MDGPLCDSIEGSDDTSITQELIFHGANVDSPGNRSRPVVWAAQSDSVPQLKMLLEAGADPSLREG
eukprot:36435-Eustigmatos_ZCMA.PRE.1